MSVVMLLKLILWSLFLINPSFGIEIVQTTQSGESVSIYESNKCDPMKVGERRQVNLTSENSPTGVRAFYSLKKVAPQSYSIDLNVAFLASPSYDGDLGGYEQGSLELDLYVDRIYRSRLIQCFNKIENRLKDSRGNSFSFHISSDQLDRSQFTNSAERVYVEISSKNHRSHSEKYSSSIDCPTFIHEALHLLGLCDEYKEQSTSLLSNSEAKARGFSPPQAAAYDCRKVGPETSIMNNQYRALEDSFTVTYGFCDCDVGKSCSAKGRVLEAQECPKDMHLLAGRIDQKVMGESDFQMYERDLADAGITWLILKKQKNPKSAPALSDEQADVILHPGCEKVNGEYYRCAQDAYRTSRERGGEGCIGKCQKTQARDSGTN